MRWRAVWYTGTDVSEKPSVIIFHSAYECKFPFLNVVVIPPKKDSITTQTTFVLTLAAVKTSHLPYLIQLQITFW